MTSTQRTRLMLVEIDQQTLDDMFKKVLVEDWKSIKREIKDLKSREVLLDHHKEDLKYTKKNKKAYERLIRYTHTHDESEEILGRK